MSIQTRRPTKPAAPTRENWRKYAACKNEDPELFFPAGSTGSTSRQADEAKRVCFRCPAIDLCLSWALENRQDTGVWGGLTEKERQRLHRRRRQEYRGGVQTALNNILTNRLTEFQVLEAQGLKPAQIAKQLGTNVHTVNRVRATLTGQQARGVKAVKAA